MNGRLSIKGLPQQDVIRLPRPISSTEPQGRATPDRQHTQRYAPQKHRRTENQMTEKNANNPYVQAIFDCRDVLLPRGPGKGNQRRRTDLRNVLFTLATQGDPKDDPTNGLWWDMDRLSTVTGIGKKQLRAHLDWLERVGLIGQRHRMNTTTIRWVMKERLRVITQRQSDDRLGYIAKEASVLSDERQSIPPFDPEDLEEVYFHSETTQGVNSEAPTEALPEAPFEARAEAQAEARSETQSVALPEAPPDSWAVAQVQAPTELPPESYWGGHK